MNVSEFISDTAGTVTFQLLYPNLQHPQGFKKSNHNNNNVTTPGCHGNCSDHRRRLLEPEYSPQEMEVKKNWAALLILVVIAVTVTGNILVILAVSLEKKLQNATNYFLMSLAVADMLLGVLVMPVSMVTILYDYEWPLPSNFCPVWIYLDVLFSTASIMHLCAISLDRYVGIRNPMHHSRFNSLNRTRIKILAVWTISVGISMPIPVLGLQDYSKVFRGGCCLLTDNNFVLVGSFVAFFVPLTIMVVSYLLSIKALHNDTSFCVDQLVPFTLLQQQSSISSRKAHLNSVRQEAGGATVCGSLFGRRTTSSISNEQKASKVLGVVFFLFVVMWCPFFVTNVLSVVCDPAVCDAAVMTAMLNVFVWVGYLSSAVNPLVYTLFNQTYRAAFLRYICCRHRSEKRRLQLILVSTIPPLAYSAAEQPLANSGRKDGSAFSSEIRMFSLLGGKSRCHSKDGSREKDESYV